MNVIRISIFLLRMTIDAPADQILQDCGSPKSPKEKKPPDQAHDALKKKDEEERQVTRAVDQPWAGPGSNLQH